MRSLGLGGSPQGPESYVYEIAQRSTGIITAGDVQQAACTTAGHYVALYICTRGAVVAV